MTEPAGASGGVGAELARAREAAGLAVADVAQQLKFAPRQIEALEQGRYAELPAGTFARGMVRSYARLVKLDPGPLVERIAGQVAAPDNAAVVAATQRPIPIVDSSRRTNLIYAGLSLAILGVIAAVAFQWRSERAKAERLAFVPAAAQAPAAVPKEPPQTVALATPDAVTPPLATPAPPPEAPAVPPEAPAGQESEKAAPEKDKPAAPSSGKHRIVLQFERESWVEIRNRDGKILTSQLNAAGTERVVEGLAPFELVIGNAQYVRLSYDDRPVELTPHVKVEVARFTLK